jgi:hypothetical protein
MAECASVPGAAACTDGYCVDSSGQKLESGGSPNPMATGDSSTLAPAACDPLAPHELPVTLGPVLGVGKDSAGVIYMVDYVTNASIERVFVSSGDSLYRKRLAGSGSSGGGADVDYNLMFEEGSGAATRSLLIQRRGGVTTAMGIGHDPKGFIGSVALDETLTVVGEDAISSYKLRNLPGDVTIDRVADVDNGNVIVVTHPTDDWTADDFRLFYGPEGNMVERHVYEAPGNRNGGIDIQFDVNGSRYTVQFTATITPTDGGGVATHIGPGTLDAGGGTLHQVTERRPIPTTLPGFSFTCL